MRNLKMLLNLVTCTLDYNVRRMSNELKLGLNPSFVPIFNRYLDL